MLKKTKKHKKLLPVDLITVSFVHDSMKPQMVVSEEKEEVEDKWHQTNINKEMKSLSLICIGLELSGERLSSP